jgi:LuxR family maltose regulon positive regulatory protein
LPLGIAYLTSGASREADDALKQSIQYGLASGNVAIAAIALLMRAGVLLQQGRLQAGADLCRQIIRMGEAEGSIALSLAAGAYVGLAGALYEWGELVEAQLAAEKGVALGQQWANMQDQVDGELRLAFILQAQGHAQAARQAFEQAEAFYAELQAANRVVPWLSDNLASAGTLLALRQGRIDDAKRWAERLTPARPLALSLQEYCDLISARLALATDSPANALAMLAPLIPQAEAQGRSGSAIEMYALQALALHALGEVSPALAALHRALTLAAPERYARVFLDEGAALRPLLTRLREQTPRGNPARAYLARLLDDGVIGKTVADEALIEPLSDRERDVLRLLAQGRTNQEIARALIVAVSTVKTHVHHLFAKLQAPDRAQAIIRARALGLID